MSEQDAGDADGPEDGGADGAATEPVRPEADSLSAEEIDEVLAEISEAPEEDVETALAGMTGDSEPGTEAAETTPGDEREVYDVVLDHVEEMEPERVARIVVTLRQELAELETELEDEAGRAEDLESRLKRKQADFQNYKKRQKERLREEKQRATEDLVERLLDVRDNLQRALEQDEDADIRDGVESTLRQFDQKLERENVERVEPEPGDSVDPQRHEALATVAADQPADTIAGVHRPGYEMAGKIIRPAQVTVSDGSGDTAEADDVSGDE